MMRWAHDAVRDDGDFHQNRADGHDHDATADERREMADPAFVKLDNRPLARPWIRIPIHECHDCGILIPAWLKLCSTCQPKAGI